MDPHANVKLALSWLLTFWKVPNCQTGLHAAASPVDTARMADTGVAEFESHMSEGDVDPKSQT